MPAVEQAQVRDAAAVDPSVLDQLLSLGLIQNVGDVTAPWIDNAAAAQARDPRFKIAPAPPRQGIVERNMPRSFDPSGRQQAAGKIAQTATDVLGYGIGEDIINELQTGGYGPAISSGTAAVAGNVIPFGRAAKPAIGVKGWVTSPLPIQRVGMDMARGGKGVHVAENAKVGGPGGDFWNMYLHKGVDTAGNPVFSARQRAIAEQLRLHGFDRTDTINSLSADIKQNQRIANRPVAPMNILEVKKQLAEDQLQRALLQQKHNQFGPSSYQVGVRAQPNEFVDLNKFVLDHDEKVLEAIYNITKKNPDIQRRVGGQLDRTGEDITGGQMFDAIGQSIGKVDEIATKADKDLVGIAGMSHLQEHGIPGIRAIDKPTLDQIEMNKILGKGQVQPTYNYNVSDPTSVELLDMFRKQTDNVEDLF